MGDDRQHEFTHKFLWIGEKSRTGPAILFQWGSASDNKNLTRVILMLDFTKFEDVINDKKHTKKIKFDIPDPDWKKLKFFYEKYKGKRPIWMPVYVNSKTEGTTTTFEFDKRGSNYFYFKQDFAKHFQGMDWLRMWMIGRTVFIGCGFAGYSHEAPRWQIGRIDQSFYHQNVSSNKKVQVTMRFQISKQMPDGGKKEEKSDEYAENDYMWNQPFREKKDSDDSNSESDAEEY